MKILSAAAEIFPLIKTGGLADVTGALPQALKPYGCEILSIVPGYPVVLAALEDFEVAGQWNNLFGGPARLLWGKAKGLEVLVVDAPHLYNRPGNPYMGADGRDWPDNAERYAAFCWVAAEVGRGLIPDFVPDIIHAHDWQAGLIPAYVHYDGGPKTVLTIHNIAFQGVFPVEVFAKLQLPQEAFSISGIEFYGHVGFMKAGLQFADRITTVSPTYAREILTPDYGMRLQGLLQARKNVLSGILNGIDTVIWNPATDKSLKANFTAKDLKSRAKNKAAVEKHFQLRAGDGPLFCVISRLTEQKGMDLLADVLPSIIAHGGRLALLGSGDHGLEARFTTAAQHYPGQVGVVIGYDEGLSHLMQGGADSILIPSRFEPCGLTQLYGARYGCVPLVARVGGLADTVIDANDAALAAAVATGFQFLPVTAEALEQACLRAISLFENEKTWRSLQTNGMTADVSWARSAESYAALYKSLSEV